MTLELKNALGDVGVDLTDADHQALLEEARSELQPRPRVLADFVGALRRKARRILRLRALAAASAEHVAARQRAELMKPKPAFTIVERREGKVMTAYGVVDDGDSRSPAEVLASFRELAAAEAAVHRQPVPARARRLHELGLSLIALKPASKEPPARWKAHQAERLPLPRLLKQLEELGSDAGLAVVCGPVSGIVVADFDDDAGVEWATKHLRPTPWRTKTARGEHWYFLLPSSWTPPATPLPWKGELRGAGHYVVAPGSLHPDGGRYESIGWDCPKERLPMWNDAWLDVADFEALRRARSKILKS